MCRCDYSEYKILDALYIIAQVLLCASPWNVSFDFVCCCSCFPFQHFQTTTTTKNQMSTCRNERIEKHVGWTWRLLAVEWDRGSAGRTTEPFQRIKLVLNLFFKENWRGGDDEGEHAWKIQLRKFFSISLRLLKI